MGGRDARRGDLGHGVAHRQRERQIDARSRLQRALEGVAVQVDQSGENQQPVCVEGQRADGVGGRRGWPVDADDPARGPGERRRRQPAGGEEGAALDTARIDQDSTSSCTRPAA